MGLAGSARLFAANAAWRATGLRPAGRVLVEALGAPDEDARTIAGMFLVQAGKKAEPLLREAVEAREHLPLVLTIVGDIGDSSWLPELRRFAGDPDPQVARAAQDSLRLLERKQA